MDGNTGALVFILFIVVLLVGFFVWRSSASEGPGGLSLAQAGAQKQAAVTAAGAASGT